jgi:hypothetical protein
MKNKLAFLLVLAIFVFIALGCSMISDQVQKSVSGDKPNSNDNRSITDKAVDDTTDTETTGVPECDEVFKLFADQSKTKDDNWATRATRNFVLSQIKKQFKQSIDDNKDDKKQMATKCTEYKKQLETELKKDTESEDKK